MSLKEYESFSIPPVVSIEEGRGGLPCVKIASDFAEAEMYLYGAHVTRFDPKGKSRSSGRVPLVPLPPGNRSGDVSQSVFPGSALTGGKRNFPSTASPGSGPSN